MLKFLYVSKIALDIRGSRRAHYSCSEQVSSASVKSLAASSASWTDSSRGELCLPSRSSLKAGLPRRSGAKAGRGAPRGWLLGYGDERCELTRIFHSPSEMCVRRIA